ncbi:MAG: hypothetical protein AAFQ68_28075, partial [Bacteroidota bacterium]
MKQYRVLTCLCMFLAFYEVGAQSVAVGSCSARLLAAEEAYQAGKMRQVVNLLQRCTEQNMLFREEQINA